MRIVVCVKQVLDTTAEKRLTADLSLDRTAGEAILNPFDEHALEAALRLREHHGGSVTALSMGPPTAKETIRKALAMGADEAVLVSDPVFAWSDVLGTAYVLSLAVKRLEPDLVLFGMQSTDASTGQVPAAVAEFLGLPQLTFASLLEVTDGRATIRRATDDGYQVLAAKLPALVSVVKSINEPRYPSLKGIMKAKRAEVAVWSCADIGADASRVGRTGAAARVVSSSAVEKRVAGRVIRDDGTAVEQIVGFLVEKRVL